MPEIYHQSHPYFSPGDGSYKSASFIHKITFGNSVEESFPHRLVIPYGHESTWFHMDSSYSNRNKDSFFKTEADLGEYLRTNMTDDVFISHTSVSYNFKERPYEKPWKPEWTDYFTKDEDGKLIRLPVECNITFILLRFRSEVDKTQFLLMKSDEYTFMEELDDDRRTKAGARHYDASNEIRCPICKAKFDEEKYNERLKAFKEID